VTLRARSGPGEVRIEVIDDGSGMDEGVARRAFDIGFSAWGQGGVGLTIAKFIVYHHLGGISLTSRPRRGTTVTLVLPLTRDDEDDDEDDSRQEDPEIEDETSQ